MREDCSKRWAQHENRRAAMFVDEDCVDSRSDVDDLIDYVAHQGLK